jgi:hypothetical protein
MICVLFTVLAHHGYFYMTTVDVAHSVRPRGLPPAPAHLTPRAQLRPPRVVFVLSRPDLAAHFFVLTWSRAGHKLTLVDAPPKITDTLPIKLRNEFRNQITNEHTADGVQSIEFKRTPFGSACPRLRRPVRARR